MATEQEDSIADFKRKLIDRVRGIAVAQDFLTEDELPPTPLRDLLARQVATFVAEIDGKVTFSGPDLSLNPRATQVIGLAIHELGTNACKYGALSTEAGRVDLSWDLQDNRFELCWRERCGPAVVEPTRTGFGRQVTERLVSSSLQAKVDLTFDPSGVQWRMQTDKISIAETFKEGSAGDFR